MRARCDHVRPRDTKSAGGATHGAAPPPKTAQDYNEAMHKYRLVRTRSSVQVYVDGQAKLTVDANARNEMRNYMASTGLSPEEINQKVHELYMTNATEFTAGR